MAEEERAGAEFEDEEGDRSELIGPSARFTIGGKPLPLDEFITSTTGELADRSRAEPRPQPPGQPKSVVWAARRPPQS